MNSIIAVAPMMDHTDRHCRYLLRLIAPHVLLYTEMLTTGAIIHGDRERLLNFHSQEHPLAIQFGGSNPQDLAQCARIAADWGYDEINLNVGCPSDRVQQGRFGACLLAEPELVAECVAAMQQQVVIPVTVKTRIGIDDRDSYAELVHFIKTVNDAGCKTFVIHARKAWLAGLSPKENREIPPLRYDVVAQIKQDFPSIKVIINGGIKTVADVTEHLQIFDGVMIGREAYHNPYLLAELETSCYGVANVATRQEIALQYISYMHQQMSDGVPLSQMVRHLLGLYQGMTGARAWRRHISEHAYKHQADVSVVKNALDLVE